MGLVLLLLLLALVLGGVGLFMEGLKWLLIIALVLLVLSAVSGFRTRRPRL
ncbi:MAG: hydrophobic protein [Actinomycetota bacterium]|nr:hydrophobic protein [Actinomycetota bacterium]